MKTKRKHTYLFLFVLFLLSINFPLIGVFNTDAILLNRFPLLISTLFILWALIIIGFFLLSEIKKRKP